MKPKLGSLTDSKIQVVPYIGTWIETSYGKKISRCPEVVPYIGTWIETYGKIVELSEIGVVPYIGTWIETRIAPYHNRNTVSYLI